MAAVDSLRCKECKKEYALEARFVCDDCFGPLEGVLLLAFLASERFNCSHVVAPSIE